jgi:hypothetical protein
MRSCSVAFTSAVIAGVCCSIALGRQPSAAELHATAQALIPTSVRVVGQRDADCGARRYFPTCVTVYFQDRGPLGQRVAAFIAHARAKGWKTSLRGWSGQARVYLLRRGAYKTIAGFLIDRAYHPTVRCEPHDITATCADYFQVIAGE